jgi:hypothetical protein
MNVLDAAQDIGKDYPGGIESLYPRLNMKSSALLRAKLNPNCDTNHLTLKESVDIQQKSGLHYILFAMATELGYAAPIPLPDIHSKNVPQGISKMCAEFGDYLRTVDEVFDDGKVTPNEAKSLQKELTQMIAAAVRLQSILTGKGGNEP